LFLAPCLIQASINPFIFDGLLALPAGIGTARLPVSHKYTSLLAGVPMLIKFPFIKASYAVAEDKFGATVPLWHPLNAQLFVSIGSISFEKLTVLVTAGVRSSRTVVFLVQLFIMRTNWLTSINPIINIFFDMIFIFLII
jgi:hypothetical protein